MVLGKEFRRENDNLLTQFYEFEYLKDQKYFHKKSNLYLAKIIIPIVLGVGVLSYSYLNSNNNKNYNLNKNNNSKTYNLNKNKNLNLEKILK